MSDQQLLQAFQAVNPAWKQKDIQASILTAQGHISAVRNGKKTFSAQTRALITYRIQDRIAAIAGEGFSYRQIQEISAWFIRIYTDPGYFTAKTDAAHTEDRAYQAALKIHASGYLIV